MRLDIKNLLDITRKSEKLKAAAVAAEYHWSESKNCYVPISWMHPQWARNALNKFINEAEPADEIEKIHIKNLLNRITTPANRISHYETIVEPEYDWYVWNKGITEIVRRSR